MLKAFITGLAGLTLAPDEARFLAAEKPCGVILFARNCRSHEQIRTLVADARTAIGSDRVLILTDQEGGRVQRLRPPLGRALPPAAAYGALYGGDPAGALAFTCDVAHLLAEDLRALGIDTDCAPVLDVPVPGSHGIIGDRAFADTPAPVIALAEAFADGLMRGGVLPVVKHVPGHGRATKDSHLDLPVVSTPAADLTYTDFAPFKALARMPAAMTAHVIFSAFDAERPASVSALVHQRVIRGEIGYDGLLMSDDLNMHALSGSLSARAEAVLHAGSDLALHCNGNLAEMREIATAVPRLDGYALRRFEAAQAVTRAPKPLTEARRATISAELNDLLAMRGNRSESV